MKYSIEKFEDLRVWKESMILTVQIYKSLFDIKDYGLRDQLQRAVVSIPSNIAEGYDRESNKEFIRYLYIARGSCAEVRTQLYLCSDLNYISKEVCDTLIKQTLKISAMLYSLINTRKEKFK